LIICEFIDDKSFLSFSLVRKGFREIYNTQQIRKAHNCLSNGTFPLRYHEYPYRYTFSDDVLHVEGPAGEHVVISKVPNGMLSIQGLQWDFELPRLDQLEIFGGGNLCFGYSGDRHRRKLVVWDLLSATTRAEMAVTLRRKNSREVWEFLSGKHDLLVRTRHGASGQPREISVWNSKLEKIKDLKHLRATDAWVLGGEGTVVSVSETQGTVKIWKPLQDYKLMELAIPKVYFAHPISSGYIRFDTRYGQSVYYTHEKLSLDKHICAKFTDGSYVRRHIEIPHKPLMQCQMKFTVFDNQNKPKFSFDDDSVWQCLTYLDSYLVTAGHNSEVKVWSKEGKLLARSKDCFWHPKILVSKDSHTIIILEFVTFPSYGGVRIESVEYVHSWDQVAKQ
jgi:hypothetical protein